MYISCCANCALGVHESVMTQLQSWMNTHRLKDRDVAAKVKIVSRATISRIRRGVNGASKETAQKLEKITGIPWHTFIGGAR